MSSFFLDNSITYLSLSRWVMELLQLEKITVATINSYTKWKQLSRIKEVLRNSQNRNKCSKYNDIIIIPISIRFIDWIPHCIRQFQIIQLLASSSIPTHPVGHQTSRHLKYTYSRKKYHIYSIFLLCELLVTRVYRSRQ